MNPTTVGLIGIVVLVMLFFTRMPVAYVMALVGVGGFAVVVSPDAALNLLSRDMVDVFSSYGLTVIPLFILMGQLAFNAGISRKLYDTAYKLLGHTSGGLALATVCACTAFGAVCGSSAAVAATMATVGLPEMKRYGTATPWPPVPWPRAAPWACSCPPAWCSSFTAFLPNSPSGICSWPVLSRPLS